MPGSFDVQQFRPVSPDGAGYLCIWRIPVNAKINGWAHFAGAASFGAALAAAAFADFAGTVDGGTAGPRLPDVGLTEGADEEGPEVGFAPGVVRLCACPFNGGPPVGNEAAPRRHSRKPSRRETALARKMPGITVVWSFRTQQR